MTPDQHKYAAARLDIYLHGFDPQHPESPRRGLARVFGLPAAQCDALLASLPRVVKRDLPPEEAQRYLRALQSFGGVAELRPGIAAAPAAQAAAPSMPPPRRSSSAPPPAPAWQDPLSAPVAAQAVADHDPFDVQSEGADDTRARPRSMPVDGRSDWIATAELGERYPPRSALAPSLPPPPARTRGGAGSLVASGVLLAISYASGVSSLHGPPGAPGLALDCLALLLLGRGLLRLLL